VVLLSEAQGFKMKVSTAKFSTFFSIPEKPVHDRTAVIHLFKTFFVPELYTLICARYKNNLHGAESLLRSEPVLSQTRNSQHFMEPEGSLPHSQSPANCPYPEHARSSP
jgi:hypothetical protein